jgi:hypothetical protein
VCPNNHKLLKIVFMRQDSGIKKQTGNKNDKNRKGDTDRTSNQGRKASSGGIKETDNRGHRKGV